MPASRVIGECRVPFHGVLNGIISACYPLLEATAEAV
jgi:hypothetical protein